MIIQLQDHELREAVSAYVKANGITREVSEIAFTVNRSGGNTVSTEVTLSDTTTATPTTASLRPVSAAVSEPQAEAAEDEVESEEVDGDPLSEADQTAPSATGSSLFG